MAVPAMVAMAVASLRPFLRADPGRLAKAWATSCLGNRVDAKILLPWPRWIPSEGFPRHQT